MNIKNLVSERASIFTNSPLSEILKVAGKPSVISLAGGLPAPGSFPLQIISELHSYIIKTYAGAAFQYGPANGVLVLREAVAHWLKEKNISTTADNIGITSGSQGALDAIGRLFINRGDVVAVESPTYLGALDAFAPYYPNYAEIQTDAEGALPESLEQLAKTTKIKFVYLIPTFQNPTGKTISKERRVQIANIIKKYNLLLIEDDPYSTIRYRGNAVDPIQTLIPENTIYLGTFSKILAPGMRIGFYVASEEIVSLLTAAKSSVDLHTNSYGQYLAAEYLKQGFLKAHLPKIINLYKNRQEAMLNALSTTLPNGYVWTRPEGGMFIWVEGPKNVDMKKLYYAAVEKNVAYVPGEFFYTKKTEGKNTLRLNFTNVDEEKIKKAITILSTVFKTL
jgi:2-aminoadipate transaminase